MNYTDYKTPTRLDEARALLKELGPAGVPVSGSTLHVFLRDTEPKVAVDITRLGLDGIQAEDGQFVVGATTHISDLQTYHAKGWVLDRVADCFVSQLVRNMATLGGSIVRVFPWADFPVALQALNASMVITGDTERVMDSDSFFATQPFRHLQPGDLLTSIRVPALGAGQGFGWHKERRTSTDFSRFTAGACLTLEDNKISKVRIAVGAGVPKPCRVPAIEDALIGARPGPKKFEEAVQAGLDTISWKGPMGVSNEFVRHLASVLIVDVLNQAHEEAKGVAS